MLKKQRNFLRLRHAKAHDDGTLKNPLFLKMKPPRWHAGIAIAGGAVALLIACVGTTYIPVLQLEAVSVRGVVTLSAKDIEDVVREYIAEKRLPLCSSTNVYFTRLEALEAHIAAQFPLQSISLTRQGQVLEVSIIEKVTTLALRTKEKTVMLDVTGAYVRDATTEESRAIDIRIGAADAAPEEFVVALQSDMPMIMNTRNDSAVTLPIASAEAYLAIAQHLPLNGLHARAFYLDGLDAPYVRVETTEGYDVFFDTTLRTIEEQMRALHAILTTENFVPPQEYIDVRFGAYVYLK